MFGGFGLRCDVIELGGYIRAEGKKEGLESENGFCYGFSNKREKGTGETGW